MSALLFSLVLAGAGLREAALAAADAPVANLPIAVSPKPAETAPPAKADPEPEPQAAPPEKPQVTSSPAGDAAPIAGPSVPVTGPTTDSKPTPTAPPAADSSAARPEASKMASEPLPPDETPVKRPKSAARGGNAVGESASGSWIRTSAALAGVLGLIFLLAWGYRLAGRGKIPLLPKRGGPGLVEVVSRTALGHRQSLCVVRHGQRLVLVGVTGDGMRALDVITDPETTAALLGEARQAKTDSHMAEFRKFLESQEKEQRSAAESVEAEAAPPADPRARLADILTRVRELTNARPKRA